ncbi:hypothetical protein ABKN59_011748 [Abortiporus biennis]
MADVFHVTDQELSDAESTSSYFSYYPTTMEKEWMKNMERSFGQDIHDLRIHWSDEYREEMIYIDDSTISFGPHVLPKLKWLYFDVTSETQIFRFCAVISRFHPSPTFTSIEIRPAPNRYLEISSEAYLHLDNTLAIILPSHTRVRMDIEHWENLPTLKKKGMLAVPSDAFWYSGRLRTGKSGSFVDSSSPAYAYRYYLYVLLQYFLMLNRIFSPVARLERCRRVEDFHDQESLTFTQILDSITIITRLQRWSSRGVDRPHHGMTSHKGHIYSHPLRGIRKETRISVTGGIEMRSKSFRLQDVMSQSRLQWRYHQPWFTRYMYRPTIPVLPASIFDPFLQNCMIIEGLLSYVMKLGIFTLNYGFNSLSSRTRSLASLAMF